MSEVNKMSEIRFEIKKHLGVLSTRESGWTKEANIISWNDGPAKLDIRDWQPGREHMSRGVTLTKEEAENLLKILLQVGIEIKEGE